VPEQTGGFGYWHAHHSFFARLQRVDRRLISLNLAYLGFVAFLPFPTAVIGEYEGNPSRSCSSRSRWGL